MTISVIKLFVKFMGLLCDNQDDLTCINIDLADEIILCLQTELLQGDNVSSYWDAAVVGVPCKKGKF